jgi:uronate dehydrogenase
MTNHHVLITGSSGIIGNLLRKGLSSSYQLSGLDVKPATGMSFTAASMTDLAAAQPAFEGKDVVIDLASTSNFTSPWEMIYANNFPATSNALEASRRAGVKRVIFASSNHVTGMYERDHPFRSILNGDYAGLDSATIPRISTTDPVRPDGPYALSKVFGEAAGRLYSDQFNLSVICLRIGHVNPDSRPYEAKHYSTLLTARDLIHLIEQCIEAPRKLKYGIFYGVSANTWRIWEIANAEAAIGYRPRDNAESWRCIYHLGEQIG